MDKEEQKKQEKPFDSALWPICGFAELKRIRRQRNE